MYDDLIEAAHSETKTEEVNRVWALERRREWTKHINKSEIAKDCDLVGKQKQENYSVLELQSQNSAETFFLFQSARVCVYFITYKTAYRP